MVYGSTLMVYVCSHCKYTSEGARTPLRSFMTRLPNTILGDDDQAEALLHKGVQAIILDNNSFTEVPDLGMFSNVSFVSLNYNNLTAFPPSSVYVPFLGEELTLFLNYNHITVIGDATFSGFQGMSLTIMAKYNRITTL